MNAAGQSEPRTPPSVEGLAVGDVFAGRFRLQAPLGSGGMAEVWCAEDVTTGHRVALKLLRPRFAESVEAVTRFRREGEVLAALSHPAIVRIEASGQTDEGVVYLAMELLEGETLGAIMRRGVLEPRALAEVLVGVCAGLAAAHAQGVIHRDLKPDNIFVVATAHGPQVKLLDFGISKVLGGAKLTQTGEVLGTPRYMAPEQLTGEDTIDARTDVYALGVITYEALVGKPPFLATSPTDLIVAILHGKVASLRSMRPDLGADLEAVVARAMARAREARYATPIEFGEALAAAVGLAAPVKVRAPVHRTEALGGTGLPQPRVSQANRTVLEGVRAAEWPSQVPEAGRDASALRPGTFSEFEAFGVATAKHVIPRTQAVAAREAPSLPPGVELPPGGPGPYAAGRGSSPGRVSSPAYESAAGGPRPVDDVVTMRAGRVRPASGAASAVGAAADERTSTLVRAILIVGGLLAGAGTAVALFGAYTLYRGSAAAEAPGVAVAPGEDALPPPPPHPDGAPGGGHGTGSETAARAVGPMEPATEPAGDVADAPELAPLPEGRSEPEERGGADDADGRARTSRRRPAASPTPSTEVQGTVERLIDTAARTVTQTPEACIAMLDELIERAPTPYLLRQRGDCLMQAGRRADAARDYQRFCRVALDHPSIVHVRQQLASMGLGCP